MESRQYARAIYWRAKPGQFDAYTLYLQTQVEPIDHEAQRQGVLAGFTTLMDDTAGAPWTHMRLFIFDSLHQRTNMVAALAGVLAADTPDADKRAERAAHASTLRERVGEADFDVLGPANPEP